MERTLRLPISVRFWMYSLKTRMIIVFLMSTLIPLLLSGGISYVAITSILDTKIQSSVHSNLRQVQMSMENTLENLNHVSQQLAFNGTVGRELANYLVTDDILQKSELEKDIQNNMNLIRYTNPDLGQMFYYFADTKSLVFPDPLVNDKFDTDKLPILLEVGDITYYGPHLTSLSRYIHRTVLSVTRKVDVPGIDNLYVYIETNFELTQGVLEADKSAMNVSHLFVDGRNRVTYSENEEQYPLGMDYAAIRVDIGHPSGDSVYENRGDLLFEGRHNQHWKLVAAIRKGDYNSEKISWLRQFSLFICLSVVIALGFAWTIWRTVRGPLSRFNSEIKQMSNSNFHSPVRLTKILEFDFVLRQFHQMRKQIWELLQDVKEKEQRKTEVEIEKLLFQINPHFIHNTLNTLRWLARSKGMFEIDHLVSTLNRVLYYNMGKGGTTTIREEIAALTDYVELQRIRYDFQFAVNIRADEALLNHSIPRFILQPLVENSLYHGLVDEGVIEVNIATEEESILIQVRDNGAGMSAEEIERLLTNQSRERRQVGMGIGLYYVNRMIQTQFGGSAAFDIKSKPGEGTTMSLRLPLETEDHSC